MTLLAALCAAGSAPVNAQLAKGTPKAVRDSLNALVEAITRLEVLEWQHSRLVRSEAARYRVASGTRIVAFCEIPVGDYCYGPKNGGLSYGGLGTTPRTRILAASTYPRVFRNRTNSMVNKYVGALQKERKKIPGDRWLNGELVRVQVDRGFIGAAQESTEDCKAEIWWCTALEAYLIHLTGEWTKADSLWTVALSAMPESEACAWLDPSGLIEEKGFLRAYRASDCASRINMANRTWWLSDPLLSRAGNERRSEHLSRVVVMILESGFSLMKASTPAMILRSDRRPLDRPMVVAPSSPIYSDDDIGADMFANSDATAGAPQIFFRRGYPDLVMRVGAPLYTARTDFGPAVAQYPSTRASFVPSGDAVLAPHAALTGHWKVDDPTAFEFMSTWLKPVAELEYQIGWFKRGDSSRVVAASDLRGVDVLAGASVEAAFVLQRDFDQPAFVETSAAGTLIHLAADVPSDSTLVSIEAITDAGAMGRARFGSGPPQPNSLPGTPDQGGASPNELQQRAAGGLAPLVLSDILLLDKAEGNAGDLEAARVRMLGSTTIPSGAAVGIFWEVYGLAAGETATVSLTVSPEEGGFLSGVARALALRGSTDSLSVGWEESPAAGADVEARSFDLDLRTLSPGKYNLSIEVRVPGRPPARAMRKMQVGR